MSSSSASDATVIEMFSGIPALLAQTPALVRRGQALTCECLLGPTGHPFHVAIREGAMERFFIGDGRMTSVSAVVVSAIAS